MSARERWGCPEVERFADAFVDGELVGEERAAVEEHLHGCVACARRVRLGGVWKTSFKAAAPRPVASDALRARVRAALGDARPEAPAWQRSIYRAAPIAAAAALLIGLVVHERPVAPAVTAAINTYREDPPLDVTGPVEQLRDYLARRVDFRVNPPRLPDAALVGARVANIREQQAVYLVYNVHGSRVSVLVFNPNLLPVEARYRRDVGGRAVYLDGDRGYHVALVRDRGLGYAFASDLDENEVVGLATYVIQH